MKSFHRQVTDLRRSRNACRIFTAVERKWLAKTPAVEQVHFEQNDPLPSGMCLASKRNKDRWRQAKGPAGDEADRKMADRKNESERSCHPFSCQLDPPCTAVPL